MFDAGRKSFAAFSSNSTRPLSSETTFIPTIAEANSGFARISKIHAFSSESVFAGVVVVPGVGEGAGLGDGLACAAAELWNVL